MERMLAVNGTTYRILRLLGKGKGGYSYLAESDERQVVIKQIHHEPCDYYSFGNKIEAELHDFMSGCSEPGYAFPACMLMTRAPSRLSRTISRGRR